MQRSLAVPVLAACMLLSLPAFAQETSTRGIPVFRGSRTGARSTAAPEAAAATFTPVATRAPQLAAPRTESTDRAASREEKPARTRAPREAEKETPKSTAKATKTPAQEQAEQTPDAQNILVTAATQVVWDFLQEANNGQYAAANKMLTPQLQKYFDSELSPIYGTLKQTLDEITHDGAITTVTFANARVRGAGARVDAVLEFQLGARENRSFELLNMRTEEKGAKPEWRVTLKPSMRAGQSHVAPADTPASSGAPVTVIKNTAAPSPSPTPALTAIPATPSPSPTVSATPTTSPAPQQPSASAATKATTTSALSDAPWKK